MSIERALGALASRIPEVRRASPGGASLEVALGRVDRPDMARAPLLEGSRLTAHQVEQAVEPGVRAFLDGIQESREVAWVGPCPIVLGRIAAVVRERREGVLCTWDEVARREGLYAPWGRLPRRVRAFVEEFGLEAREVDAGDDIHPLRLQQEATNAVKQDREVLERTLADGFCARGTGRLYVDGPLPASEVVMASGRCVGVVKSHQTLYVSGEDLEVMMALRERERSSVFAVESRHRAPVASWYLRVRDPRGRGPFWGLVRLEVPMEEFEAAGPTGADAWSSWVLTEGAPLALPDGRWDTMAYGIRSCEEYLRAVMG